MMYQCWSGKWKEFMAKPDVHEHHKHDHKHKRGGDTRSPIKSDEPIPVWNAEEALAYGEPARHMAGFINDGGIFIYSNGGSICVSSTEMFDTGMSLIASWVMRQIWQRSE